MKIYKNKFAKVERNTKIVQDHLNGKSLYQIAKDTGLSQGRVRAIFHTATENKYHKTLVLKNKI